VTVGANGRLVVATNATRQTNSATTLTLTGSGTLDLANNTLLTNTPATTIKAYLASAYTSNSDWAGPGLSSGLAADDPITYSLGYAAGSDQSAQDAGIAVAAGQVLARPVVTGDANMDGKVDFFDIAQLLGYKYNTGQLASYTDGDLNYDGVVDFFDLTTLLSANYNTGVTFAAAEASSSSSSSSSSSPTSSAGVPEPGNAVLIVSTVASLLFARRRQAKR
jgi:hypothetical protein